MNDQAGKIIPGIPLAALDAIGDGKVRDVLRALVSTHNVRNNLAGSGDEAFITTRQALEVVRLSTLGDQGTAPRLLARYVKGQGGGTFGMGSLSGPLATINLTLDRVSSFQATVNWSTSGARTGGTRAEIHNGNGVVLLSQSDSTRGGYTSMHAASAGFRLEAGTYALTLHMGNDMGGSYVLTDWGMLVAPVAG
jgi:hypothetical protein